MTAVRRSIVALAAVLATTAAFAVSAPAAYAWYDDSLPLPGYGDMVVDDATGQVFVSGGPTGNGVVATDFSGEVTGTVDNQSGATGLALSADGSTLYVALAAGDAISAIDTRTLTETARFSTGPQTCPTYLARTGTDVWFGYGCETDWNGKVGRLDTAAATPVVSRDQQGDAIFQRAPLLASATGDGGPLVAGQLTLSLSNVHVFAVENGRLDPGANGEVVGSNLADASVSSDGQTVLTASKSRDHVEAFDTGSLARRGAYAIDGHPNAAAFSPDSTYLAAGAENSGDEDVLVYQTGGTDPVRTFDLDGSDVVADGGLAWSADLGKLFVVSQSANGGAPSLNVVTDPTQADDGGGICLPLLCL